MEMLASDYFDICSYSIFLGDNRLGMAAGRGDEVKNSSKPYLDDRFELYKLALKKVREAGYAPTRDRVWDQYVTLAVKHNLPKYFLEKHDFETYWEALKELIP